MHHAETVIARLGKHGEANAKLIAMARNYLPQLLDELVAARAALKGWEVWEAGIITDPACWQGSHPVLLQRHLDALTPLAMARWRALYGEQDARNPATASDARSADE